MQDLKSVNKNNNQRNKINDSINKYDYDIYKEDEFDNSIRHSDFSNLNEEASRHHNSI